MAAISLGWSKLSIAFVAQLGERMTEDHKVRGSIPRGGTFLFLNIFIHLLFYNVKIYWFEYCFDKLVTEFIFWYNLDYIYKWSYKWMSTFKYRKYDDFMIKSKSWSEYLWIFVDIDLYRLVDCCILIK